MVERHQLSSFLGGCQGWCYIYRLKSGLVTSNIVASVLAPASEFQNESCITTEPLAQMPS